MNRIFKFRVWAIEGKFWVKVYDFAVGKNGIYPSGVSPESIIIQQFTGILDKNNREIYEGDILSLNYNKYAYAVECYIPISEQFADMVTVVKFQDGSFIIDPSRPSTVGECDRLLISVYGSIVGNIFENPELLNK